MAALRDSLAELEAEGVSKEAPAEEGAGEFKF